MTNNDKPTYAIDNIYDQLMVIRDLELKLDNMYYEMKPSLSRAEIGKLIASRQTLKEFIKKKKDKIQDNVVNKDILFLAEKLSLIESNFKEVAKIVFNLQDNTEVPQPTNE